MHTCAVPLAHLDTRHTLISRTDTHHLSTCDLVLRRDEQGQGGMWCWEPQKPISQEESFLAGRRGEAQVVGWGYKSQV